MNDHDLQSDEHEDAEGTTSLADLRRAQIAWQRATQAADFDHRRCAGDAWSQYQRTLDEVARECSQQCLDASESGISGSGSPQEAADAARNARRCIDESIRTAAHRRRAAERRYEEERQRAWLDAVSAGESANAVYHSVVNDVLQAAVNGTIDPGSDEGATSLPDDRFTHPAWGYRWR